MDFWVLCCICFYIQLIFAGLTAADLITANCDDERSLEESDGVDGFVLAGSSARYCPSETKLTLNLSLAIPKNGADQWQFRIELVNEDGSEDATRFACDYNTTFVQWKGMGHATGRLTRTMAIDHIFSGDYVLNILRTVDSKTNGRVSDRKYSTHLGRFTTDIVFHRVKYWNISIDIPPEKITESSILIRMRHLNNSKRFGFRHYQLIVRREGVKVAVRNFTDDNIEEEVGSSASNIQPIHVSGLSSGNYTLQIVPLDRRCNTPNQSVSTLCPEYCERQFGVIRTRSSAERNSFVYEKTNFRNVGAIIGTSVVLLILLVAATVSVIRHRSLRIGGVSHAVDTSPALLSVSSAFQSVLLVYDFRDPTINQKARLFHQELLRIGIAKVYDFADEDQKEDVATEAVEWFPSRIRDPTVHIIIIESDGLVQCREAWKKAAAPLDGLESNILCHALEQIRLQELSHRFLRYTRISVVSFDGVNTATGSTLDLNPYVRFNLPADMPLLTKQLFV